MGVLGSPPSVHLNGGRGAFFICRQDHLEHMLRKHLVACVTWAPLPPFSVTGGGEPFLFAVETIWSIRYVNTW